MEVELLNRFIGKYVGILHRDVSDAFNGSESDSKECMRFCRGLLDDIIGDSLVLKNKKHGDAVISLDAILKVREMKNG